MTTKLVHVNIIKAACLLYLKTRKERIEETRAALIESAREPYRKWFRWRHRTYSQAVIAAKTNEEYWDCAITGGKWAGRAEAILSLCEIPGHDMIVLDREDAAFLEPWIERAVEGR